MNRPETDRIILGVSSECNYEGALQFAVDEALRLRRGLTVMHALSESLAPPPDTIITFGGEVGRHHFVDRSDAQLSHDLVNEVAHRARAMGHKMIDVDILVPTGHQVHSIVEAAVGARLIVLQHRDLSFLERIMSASTSVRVALRSSCPVVIVASPWYPRTSFNRVTAGIDDITNCEDILRVAFESAEARLAGLDIVHSWKHLAASSDSITYGSLTEEIRSSLVSRLDEVLAPWRRDFPTVTVEQHTFGVNAAEALTGHSQHSDLIVIGRHESILPHPFSLGIVARTLLTTAHCPVEIVPQIRSHQGGALEAAGDHV